MNWSPVLDTAIALVFIYVILSLVSIAINELIVRVFSLRSKTLVRGLKDLLNDENLALIGKLYEHRLVKGLQGMERKYLLFGEKSPTGIPNRNFAQALVQVLAQPGFDAAVSSDPKVTAAVAETKRDGLTDKQLKTANDALAKARQEVAAEKLDKGELLEAFGRKVTESDNPAIRALLPLYAEARGDFKVLREKLEEWFDQSTKSLTEFYRNQTKVIALIVGFALAVAFNADSFYMATKLWHDSGMRSAIVAEAQATVTEGAPFDTTLASTPPTDSPVAQVPTGRLNQKGRDLIASIDSLRLPLGWYRIQDSTKVLNKGSSAKNVGGQTAPKGSDSDKAVSSRWAGSKCWLVRFLGYLFTGAAVSMGAPFWYDLLGRLVGLRASLKSKEEAPA